MSGTNVITANFTNNKRASVTRKIYKGDYGQKILVKGLDLPENFQVHFSHDLYKGTAKTVLGQNNEILIPDEYLSSGKTIYAWIFLHQTSEDGETRHVITIPVIGKPDVVNTKPTPVQQELLTQAISLLQHGVEDAEAWATGKRKGIDVSQDDITYENNSKYYSEQAKISKEQSDQNVKHYPKIVDNYWYVWDSEKNEYINTWQKAQGERDSISKSISGDIIYIKDGGKDLPIQRLIVNIEPQQEGTGDPIYYNIRPFKSGTTKVVIETRGVNLFDESRFSKANFVKIVNPTNIFYDTYCGSLRNLGNNSASAFHIKNGGLIGKTPLDDEITISFDSVNILPRTYVNFYYTDGSNSSNYFIGEDGFSGHSSFHSDPNKKVSGVNFYTLGGSSSYAGIKNLQIERGPQQTEYTNYAKTYQIDWSDTIGPIYGGYLDVISGELVSTCDFIQSYNGEQLPGKWYSDRQVYQEGSLPTIGAQVVYETEQPIIYHLDPVEIKTLLGINNIWSDKNTIYVEYLVDQNTYINNILEQLKNSGVFDGRGIQSINVNPDYSLTFAYTDGETYTTPFSVRGEPGQDGYTPIKGVDYYTEADKNQLINLVTDNAIQYLQDTNIYSYKGTVTDYQNLPQNPVKGAVYNVVNGYEDTPPGTNWAWNGEEWDALGGSLHIDIAKDEDIDNMLTRLGLMQPFAEIGSAIIGITAI